MNADGFLGVGIGKVKADRSQSITQMISCGRQLSVSELGPIVSCLVIDELMINDV